MGEGVYTANKGIYCFASKLKEYVMIFIQISIYYIFHPRYIYWFSSNKYMLFFLYKQSVFTIKDTTVFVRFSQHLTPIDFLLT
jgi:hypothetical protein